MLQSSPTDPLSKCVKCGACMAVCPIYRQTGREDMVARGKLNLIENFRNSSELPNGWLEAIDHCLLCCSCEENCSKNVKITEIIAEARQLQVEKKGLHPLKRAAFTLLRGKILSLGRFLKIAFWGQWLWGRRLPRQSGLHQRLPIPGLDKKTVLPQLPARNLDTRLKQRRPRQEGEKIMFFPGCATRFLFPDLGLDLIEVLEKLSFSVITPNDFVCCGMVAWGSGDRETQADLIQRNLAVLRTHPDIDTLVTACASCGHALKEYHDLPENLRIFDISEFLYRHQERLEALLADYRQLSERICYHDPCHLRKGQKITREPRWLLRLIAGDNFVEMKHPERCCGAGGTFGLTHKQLSRQILAEKSCDIDDSGCQIVASGCPGCLLQLTEGAVVAEADWQARHPVTLLNQILIDNNLKTAGTSDNPNTHSRIDA